MFSRGRHPGLDQGASPSLLLCGIARGARAGPAPGRSLQTTRHELRRGAGSIKLWGISSRAMSRRLLETATGALAAHRILRALFISGRIGHPDLRQNSPVDEPSRGGRRGETDERDQGRQSRTAPGRARPPGRHGRGGADRRLARRSRSPRRNAGDRTRRCGVGLPADSIGNRYPPADDGACRQGRAALRSRDRRGRIAVSPSGARCAARVAGVRHLRAGYRTLRCSIPR